MVNAQTQSMTQRPLGGAPGPADPSAHGRPSPAWFLVLVAVLSICHSGFADEQQVASDQLTPEVSRQVFRILA